MALILVPSSAVAWAATAFYAAVQAGRTSGPQRTGAVLFLMLGLCALWSSVLLKWIAGPVTTAEATVIGWVMGWLRPDIVQSGNVIGNPDSHSLILMTACTTANALPVALLALVAVSVLLGGIPRPGAERRRLVSAGVGLTLLYAVANVVRLGIMSLSSQAYAITHGPIGANIFDAVQTLAVLALANHVSRR